MSVWQNRMLIYEFITDKPNRLFDSYNRNEVKTKLVENKEVRSEEQRCWQFNTVAFNCYATCMWAGFLSVAFILSRSKCFQIDQTVSYNAFRAPLFLHNMCNMIYYLLGLCRILLLSIGIVCLFYLLFGGSMEMNASVYIMMNQDGSHVVIIAFHEPKWKIVSKLSSSTDFK